MTTLKNESMAKFNINERVRIVSDLDTEKNKRDDTKRQKYIGKIGKVIKIFDDNDTNEDNEEIQGYNLLVDDKLLFFYEHDLQKLSNIQLI